MILLIHGALGAACGSVLRRPAATLAAAVLSHFLIDAVGHEEPFDEDGVPRLELLSLDALLLGLALAVVARRHGALSAQSLGAVAASLPDAEHLLRLQKGSLRSPVHDILPHSVWPAQGIGLGRQFIIGAAAWLAFLAFRSSRRSPGPVAGAQRPTAR